MDSIIIDNVSIRYIMGDFKDIGLKEYVVRRLKRDYKINEFWAVKNVNFKLAKGELLGKWYHGANRR